MLGIIAVNVYGSDSNIVSSISTNAISSNSIPEHATKLRTEKVGSEKDSSLGQLTLTVVVSIITTVLTTIATTYVQRWLSADEKRSQLLQSEFKEAIKDLKSASEEVAHQVVLHLSANPFSGSKQSTSQREIQYKLKTTCLYRKGRVQTLLNEEDGKHLEQLFLKWKGELTGDPFPVTKKEFVCKLHDPAVKNVQQVQEDWNGHLDSLVRDCMVGKIKLPLAHKTKTQTAV